MTLHPNDLLHGFRVKESRPLPEIRAELWSMEYEKNGAELIWLDREDDNQTFAIAFKTIPQDDTGVFHILEHSVLCGSEKYPLKEPFVNLLKSSMATFLNAFTFPDKTMYPVCSRNGQDFLNLIDVYMDAVLHPLSITDPHAFRQEGWHFELDAPDGALRCNGVVYNEMKGAYASAETVLYSQLESLLFPDSCYGFESGGHPDHIPELTYADYLAAHARFYHPSNARIILDGQMDLDAVLAKLDSFLREYDRIEVDAEIPLQRPVAPPERTCEYEIGPDEDERNKAILALGWGLGRYDELEDDLAFNVLADALAGSNEAPLTKALLDAGLAEDVSLQLTDGMAQQYAALIAKNADPEKKDEIFSLVRAVLSRLADEGLDRIRLHSLLNNLEFTTREKDFGSYPRGLIFAMNSLNTWLYGGDPAQMFFYHDLFRSLREKIDSGWFEAFLRRTLLDNPHHASLVMLPSKTLGAERAEREAARCAAIKAAWTDAEIQTAIDAFQTLRARQAREDTPEQLRTLPRLALSDIPEKAGEIRQNILALDGVTVLHHPEETDGILYLDLYFDLSDLTEAELSCTAFYAGLLGDIATERFSALALRSEIEGKLGRFMISTPVYAPQGSLTEARPMLCVTAALLPERKDDAVAILDEVLNRTDFTNQNDIFNLLRQSRMGMEQRVIAGGNAFGAVRTAAAVSARGAVHERMQGITQLRWLQAAEKSFRETGARRSADFAALSRRLFSRRRLTMSVTGELDETFLRRVQSVLSDAPMGPRRTYAPLRVRREGFVIPAEIGFAAKASNLFAIDAAYSGAARVAGQILTYGYLWNDIRVVGGAYGTGLSVRPDGDVRLTTYRDPSPARSLGSFDRAGQALRDFCAGDNDLDGFIISTIAAGEPIISPSQAGLRGASLYFTGRTDADRQRTRIETLSTTREDLVTFSHALDQLCAVSGVCVVGGRDAVDACDMLETVEALQ